jgi:hypothetical protein
MSTGSACSVVIAKLSRATSCRSAGWRGKLSRERAEDSEWTSESAILRFSSW